MLGRGFVAVRLAFAGGSAFIKQLRPSSSTTLAMCPLPFCASNGPKNDVDKIAQRASVARISHPRFVARLSIHHASEVRHTLHSSSSHTAAIILERPLAVNATSVLCALDLLVGMPLSHWKLRPPPLRLVGQNTPGNATSAASRGLSGMNLPIGVVSWNRTALAHNGTKAQAHYNKASTREGTLCKAVFRPLVSFPPASARSGLPPPEPPTCLASACISLPAWTLAVRSLVTPAIRATFPSSGMPSATTPEPSFCRRLSTNCLSPSRSTFCTSAAITLIPLTTCARPASSSIWLSAPLRFCASSSFSSCLAVWVSFST